MRKMTYGLRTGEKSLQDRLKWLLRFKDSNLDQLTPGGKLDLWLEAWNFHIPLLDYLPGETAGIRMTSRNLRKLRRIQSDLRDGFQAIQDGRDWVLPSAPSEWRLKPLLRGQSRVRVATIYRGSFPEKFFAAVADVLQQGWEVLRQCQNPECRKPFVPFRKQTYCQPKCSQDVRWNRVQAKGRKRDYHKEYQRSVEKKLGKGVKAARRPRKT